MEKLDAVARHPVYKIYDIYYIRNIYIYIYIYIYVLMIYFIY